MNESGTPQDLEKLKVFWLESSEKDYKTMLDLRRTNHNHWSLFMGHLVIEKLLKALYIKERNTFPPMIHDLRRIGEKAGLKINERQKSLLDSITRFNIKARYDDYKHSFYKLCTDDFTEKWMENINECRKWIRSKLEE